MKNKKINFFDIHCHIHSQDYADKKEREFLYKKLLEKKIFANLIGVDFKDSKKAFEIASEKENFFCSMGQHPVDNEIEVFEEKKYQEILDKDAEKTNADNKVFPAQKKIICIGECGLDYFWLNKDLESKKKNIQEVESQKKRQKDLFEKQIDLAVKNDLPLMLHVRSFKNSDAHFDCFEILDKKQKEHNGKIKANFHFFTEGPEIVLEIIERGFFISLPGVITFANLDKSIEKIPIEKIMSETDSPYATPKPHRGEKNSPLFVPHIIAKIAKVKNISEEKCNEILIKNALDFFKIDL